MNFFRQRRNLLSILLEVGFLTENLASDYFSVLRMKLELKFV